LSNTNLIGQNSKQNVSTDELSSCENDEKLSVNSFTEENLIFNVSATTTPVKASGIPISSASNNSSAKLITKIPASSFTNTSSKMSEFKRGNAYSLNSYNLKDSLIKTYMDQYQILPNLPESNLVLNEQRHNFLSNYNNGAGGGVMKRLMRSFSNSLSSTNTLMNLSGVDGYENSNENKHNQELNNKLASTTSTSVNSKTSLTSGGGGVNNYLNETSLQGVMCEKCNRYPKFKIGVCVIYCLPLTNTYSAGGGTLSNSSLSSSFSNNSSSTSSNSSSAHSPKTANNNQQQNQHNQSFDKFSFFPHIDSPDFNSQRSSSKLHKQNSSTATPTMLPMQHSMTTSPTNSNWNENFYEFFSSHLPLIEYQFKELKEKIIVHLPLYFNPVVICAPSNVNGNLIVNRRNNSFSSNNSTTSSQASETNDTNLRLAHQYFIQQIFIVSRRISFGK
jgi:hypothetical protein